MDRLHAVREAPNSTIYPVIVTLSLFAHLHTILLPSSDDREGIKLRNATFVIAGGPLPNNSDDAAAPVPAVSTAAAQVLRFLEKHPLRGAILIGNAPPAYHVGQNAPVSCSFT